MIETFPGEVTTKRFIRDPLIPENTLCEECKEIHEDLMQSYVAKDDPYGWNAYKGVNDNELIEVPVDILLEITPEEAQAEVQD
jgi:hypothetical protein